MPFHRLILPQPVIGPLMCASIFKTRLLLSSQRRIDRRRAIQLAGNGALDYGCFRLKFRPVWGDALFRASARRVQNDAIVIY